MKKKVCQTAWFNFYLQKTVKNLVNSVTVKKLTKKHITRKNIQAYPSHPGSKTKGTT